MRNQQRKTSGVRWIAALCTVALLAVGAGSAAAGPAEKGGADLKGMQVHVDPATGKLRQPTAAEVKALADAFRAKFAARSVQGAQVTEHTDGSVSAKLGLEALNVWVATVNPDGSISQVCVEGVNAATPVAPALEEK
jgi:hypothetical protein